MKGKKIFLELLLTISFLFIYINCAPPCSGANSYLKGLECVSRDLCRFYSDNQCWEDCSLTSPYIKPYHNYGDKECINDCTGEYLYKNETYNRTLDLWAPIIFLVSFVSLISSIIFYVCTRKKEKPAVPDASENKNEITTAVKSDKSMKTQYSDDHLIVTSNMEERLKMFDKKVK